MSALDDLIEEARANGVRNVDELPLEQQKRLLALAVSVIDGVDALSGVDISGLISDAIMTWTLDEAVKRHGEISWAVYTAYKDAAIRYINGELNNGK